MSAKRKKHSVPVEDGRDKPDYAADLFRKEDLSGRKDSRRKQADKNKEDSDGPSTVAEHLEGDMAAKLRQMKAALEEAESNKRASAKGASAQKLPLQKRPNQSRKNAGDVPDKETASFAELFDPAPADEDSFEDMLNNSKLDWQKFKD